MKALRYSAIVLAGFFLFAACQKEFSLDSGVAGVKAGGTSKDSLGNCLPITVKGNYLTDSTLIDSNYVTVQVNFSSSGSYSIATDTANGFSFSGTGVIKDSGLQNIILKGVGKPALAQQTNFSIVFNSSVCAFSVSVQADSTGGGPTQLPQEDSAWQFSEGSNFYHGYLDTVFTQIDSSVSKDSSVLSFYGSTATGTDTLFQLDILLPGKTIQTGTYSTNASNVDFYLFNSDTSIAPYYRAYAKISTDVNLQVVIQSYDSENGIVSGSFSGTALNAAGQTVTIAAGKIYGQLE